MLFNSLDFGIFLPIVFILYWVFFQKNIRARNFFLITVSYIFYGWWDWRFLSLIIISSTVDYFTGKKIHIEGNQKKRKRWLLLSLLVNLGFLGFFKYYNFFVDSFVASFSLFGATFSHSSLDIILPVGISFYTFQTLSYTLDIYFKKFEPTNDVFSFFAFVAFFPQLVAGPIERAKNLLPQFFVKREISYDMLRSGLLLMAWGFFKKIVLADRLARYVDSAYDNVGMTEGGPAIIAVIFFAFQLYLDFSGYSDIAIGTARLLGFNLSENFKRPYLSTSFSDFWKRWHISLSSWFKDYVYIPLGGSRVKKSKIIRNVMIVFLLSGLWHGASWNFVIWGAINGLFIILFDRFFDARALKGIRRFFVSAFISFAWAFSLILFRAQSFQDSVILSKNIFSGSSKGLYEFELGAPEFKFTLILLLFFMLFEILLENKQNIYQWFISQHFILRWIAYIAIASFIILFGAYGAGLSDNNFIYFQF